MRVKWAAALVATAVACAHQRPENTARGEGARRAARPPEALVAELAREVEAIRGMRFRALPAVRVETPEAITAHLRQELDAEREDLALEGRLGVALGVLPSQTDLAEVLARFVGAEAQGYYDPDDRALVLTAAEAEALTAAGPQGVEARATVVHELTHALQHQHFARRVESASQRGPAFGDLARARLALLEGDATLVTLEWTARRRGGAILDTPALGARIDRWAAGAQVLTEVDVPTYVIAAAELPYEAGAVGVGAMYAAGGWARVNTAIGRDDLRAAEVLHPTRENTVFGAVAAPAGEGAVLTETLGEMELRLMLGRVMRADLAARRAQTWRGDAAVLFHRDGRDALAWRVACEGEAGAGDVIDALGPLAARWRREGCPTLRGGTATGCPVSLGREGATVTLARGDVPGRVGP